jgi:hypothetical protein
MFSIVSTRFNEYTWKENVNYRYENNVNGCSYGAPYMMSPKIELGSLVFVVEMNNSYNKIEGIGLVRNKASLDKHYNIHSERNYNRYSFHGKYRVDRNELERTNPELVTILDYILFKEKTHLKRGIGFTSVPEKLLKHPKCNGLDIKNEMKLVFIHLFGSTSFNNKINEKNKINKKNIIIVEEE